MDVYNIKLVIHVKGAEYNITMYYIMLYVFDMLYVCMYVPLYACQHASMVYAVYMQCMYVVCQSP